MPRDVARRSGGAPAISVVALALGAAAAIPTVVLAAVFRQWPQIRAELRDEASLGFFEAAEVRSATHPFLRLGRNRWVDLSARREYVLETLISSFA